jgi:hypothetical protein
MEPAFTTLRKALIDGHTADIETVQASSLDNMFTGAVITRSRVAAAVVRFQFAAAMSADTNTLQQGSAPSLTTPPPDAASGACWYRGASTAK